MRRLVTITLLLGIAGCVTPSIPIPPPDPIKMTFQLTGDVNMTTTSLTYPPTENYKGGIAFVYNRSRGEGTIQSVKPDGSIGPTAPIPAALGEQIVVSVENDEQTVSTCILLQAGTQDPNRYCD